jgi:hypothetical protein
MKCLADVFGRVVYPKAGFEKSNQSEDKKRAMKVTSQPGQKHQVFMQIIATCRQPTSKAVVKQLVI